MKLDISALSLPLKHPFTITRGSSTTARTALFRLRWDGLEGLGEAAPIARYGESIDSIKRYFSEHPILTDDPYRLEELLHPAIPPAALCGLDFALHDLIGKDLDRPLWQLFGLDPSKTPLTSFTIGLDTIPAMLAKVREIRDHPVLKIKLGTGNELEIIAAIRSQYTGTIRIDANEGWSAEQAASILNEMERYEIEFCEQPIKAGFPEQLRYVRERTTIPIVADEDSRFPSDLGPLIGCVDGVNVKLVKCGGLRSGLAMIHTARALGFKVMLGCMLEEARSRRRPAPISRPGRLGRSRRAVSHQGRSLRGHRLQGWQDRPSRRPGPRGRRALPHHDLGIDRDRIPRRSLDAPLRGLGSTVSSPREEAKTAHGVIAYSSDSTVAAVIDPDHAGKRVRDVVSYVNSDAPIVADLRSALAFSPNALLVGVAPPGGALPPTWRAAIVAALEAGLEVVSGLHEELGRDAELLAAARRGKSSIWDVRVPPAVPLFSGAAYDVEPHVALFVGSDCAVGKMTTALELDRAARARGVRSRFVATGQTGIMIAGTGIAIDRVISDFAPGAAERQLVLENAVGNDLLFIEGQGGINHPAYAPVTLSLLYGSAPDSLILVHLVARSAIDPYQTPILSYRELIGLYERLTGTVKPARVVGIALNTHGLDDAQARKAIEDARAQTGLPADDVVRHGPRALFDALAPSLKGKRPRLRACAP